MNMNSESTGVGCVSPQGGTTSLDENGKWCKALTAINRYQLAEQSYDHRCYSRAERDTASQKQRECLLILAEIDDPLVQAITARLTIDKHSSNAGVLIRKLISKVAL